MKLSKLMIAAIAVCGASQAMAAGVTRLTGSSASSINVVRGAVNMCVNNGGSALVYKTSSSTSSLGNQFTVTCSTDFDANIPVTANELRVNVANGSETAITNAAAYPSSTTIGFLVPSGSCTALPAGTESLSFLAAGQMLNCGTTLADNSKSDGGFMDEEGPVFNTSYDAGDFAPSGFSQVFGIAVNSTLYNDLQAYQKTVAGGNIVPATCAAGDTTPACQPSLSRAQITSLINSSTSNPAKTGGLAYLVPAAYQTAGLATGGNKITYCKRPQSSGTQQGAQLYFLNYDALGSLGGKEPIIGNVTLSKYAAVENASSGNVKNCLNANTLSDGYKFGSLSMENNPIGGSDTYRFVRLSEVAATEGVAGASQTATAIAGRYDYVYELSAYCPAGTCAPVIEGIKANVAAGTSSPGIFVTGVESRFGRGGNSNKPYASR
ncbi:hypothetical protein JY96_07795 [Aquabacterium sp. NJ1]|uniref:hypothetical protein n=1 Tax=Aquabacterium sp. NJ1 TaxID=1538295 RepID=UPI00052BBACA|nr:hypothetical protein [Aquabacterium sp. NJ1]KGM39975.1 hypothetical protein JY96_07795 [Aquabacterium sp. NJ1]